MAKDKSAGTGGSRQATVRVKTAKRRKTSSTRWLQRQLNDPYVAEAKRLGYRSRAAFKMIQIDDKFRLLKRGGRVIDLGCAPGGWTQIAVDRVGSDKGSGVVIGMDLLPVEPIPGATLLQADFLGDDALDMLAAVMPDAEGKPAVDVVLTDMAASGTGHASTDHLRIIGLAEAALDFAVGVLRPGGGFVAKVFSGGAEATLLQTLKANFAKVSHFKPPASRKESAEMYVVATGFTPTKRNEDN
ncbi:MAG: RlmE family RNA methyltransferase [Alphaproteobacteria bacterium]